MASTVEGCACLLGLVASIFASRDLGATERPRYFFAGFVLVCWPTCSPGLVLGLITTSEAGELRGSRGFKVEIFVLEVVGTFLGGGEIYRRLRFATDGRDLPTEGILSGTNLAIFVAFSGPVRGKLGNLQAKIAKSHLVPVWDRFPGQKRFNFKSFPPRNQGLHSSRKSRRKSRDWNGTKVYSENFFFAFSSQEIKRGGVLKPKLELGQ